MGTIRNITDYYSGEVFMNVEITAEDELPRGCDACGCATDEETFERYTIYKDCVTRMLYAVLEEE